MSRSLVVRVFWGSVIGLGAGLVLMVVAGALALAQDVFVMNGPTVVGLRSGPLAVTLAVLVGLAVLVLLAAAAAVFVAWIGAVLATAELPEKTWFVLLLVVGMLGFVFLAALAYVVAGPDRMPRPQVPGADAPSLPTSHDDVLGPAGSRP